MKDTKTEDYADILDNGTMLLNGAYRIEKFINSGGFGITYLARDDADKRVVIKECFPTAICRRTQTLVAARARNHAASLENSIKSFRQEAESLKNLVHANIVRVHDVFDENNTSYMVIDYIEGLDLQEMIKKAPKLLTPEYLVKLLEKLLLAVQAVHDSGMLHRDISPDNILLRNDHEPVLIDFGAARGDVSKQSRLLSTLNVVKDGYSPQEFYLEGSLQNESSDLYALAATFYHCIAGETPPHSQKRLFEVAQRSAESYQPLAGRFEGYPENFLGAIDKALMVMPGDRLQSAKEWLAIIDPNQAVALPRETTKAAGVVAFTDRLPMVGAGAAAVLALGLGAYFLSGSSKEPEKTIVATAQLSDQSTAQVNKVEPSVVTAQLSETVIALDEEPKTTEITSKVMETSEETVQVVKNTKPVEQEPEIVAVVEEIAAEPNNEIQETIDVAKVVEQTTPKVETSLEVVQETKEEQAVAQTNAVNETIPDTSNALTPEPVIVSDDTVETPKVETVEPTVIVQDVKDDETKPETQVIVTEVAQEPASEAEELIEIASISTPRQSALNDASEFRADTADDDSVIRDFTSQGSNDVNFFAGLSNATDRVDDALVTDIGSNAFTIQEALPDSVDKGDNDLAPIFQLIDPDTTQVAQPVLEAAPVVKSIADLTPTPSVSLEFSDWTLDVPFLLADAVKQGRTGSFPVITAIRNDADLVFSGSWIKPGVTVYAIDQVLLPPADNVPAFLETMFANRAPNPISATARISTGAGSKAQDTVLQLGFIRTLRLSNGLEVKQRFSNKLWQLVVTKVPQSGSQNVQVNDVLLNDRGLGLKLSSLNDFTRMINLTKGSGLDTAEINIRRGNATEIAFLKF